MENITIGQVVDFIIKLAAFIGAVGVIIKISMSGFTTILEDKLKPIREELHKNSLNTMKNTICNDNIPLSERISVGKEYIEKGGNGAVKIYYHKLEEKYEKQLAKEEKKYDITR